MILLSVLNIKENQKGTLMIELFVVLAILTIASAISLPNFKLMCAKLKAKMVAQELQQLIQFARTSAISYGQRVTMCPLGDSTSCGDNWARGIIVYLNPDYTTKLIKTNILRITTGKPAAYTLQFKAFISNFSLSFDSRGEFVCQNGRFYYHSKNAECNWRLAINYRGRSRLTQVNE